MLNLNTKITMKDKLDKAIIANCIETFNAIEYFESFRMEELKQDDQFYIKHMIKYIKYLEFQIQIKNKVLDA
jgi:hypothetical protein